LTDRLPSPHVALKLLTQSGCTDEVIAHCRSVVSLALQLAKACKKKGIPVNAQLVEIGALLHDIGRSVTHSVHHAIKGAEIARSLNLPESVISIIERHVGGGLTLAEATKLGWPTRSYLPRTLEEKIVTYADKLIMGSRRVRIERTLNEFSRDLGDDHPSLARIQKLHDEFTSLIGDFDA
jgi:uncharacterized protein